MLNLRLRIRQAAVGVVVVVVVVVQVDDDHDDYRVAASVSLLLSASTLRCWATQSSENLPNVSTPQIDGIDSASERQKERVVDERRDERQKKTE